MHSPPFLHTLLLWLVRSFLHLRTVPWSEFSSQRLRAVLLEPVVKQSNLSHHPPHYFISPPVPFLPTNRMAAMAVDSPSHGDGIKPYYTSKIQSLRLVVAEKAMNLRRLEAQRNELNAKVRMLREELQLLQEPGSYVGEVVKLMGKTRVLCKVNPEGKYVVDIDPEIDIAKLTPTTRVALRNDSYTLHKLLPNKVDPMVALMMVEKVPDSTYEMVGGLAKQIQEIKEVIELPIKHPELFEALGIAQPKGVLMYGTSVVYNQRIFSSLFRTPASKRQPLPVSLISLAPSTFRATRNWQDAPGPCCCTSYGLLLHSSFRV